MKKHVFYILLFFMYFSSNVLGWETKEEFDKDFKASVEQFLKNRGQSYILVMNLNDFVESHMKFLKEYNKFCVYDQNNPNRPLSGVIVDMESFSKLKFDELDTYFCVGPMKPLSNLPTHTVIYDEDIKSAIENWADKVGYKTYLDGEVGKYGALWVFDPIALSRLLNENLALLKENNVSSDPMEFIKEIDKEDENKSTRFELSKGNARMFQLIARAFGREMSLEDIEKLMATKKK